MSESRKMNLIKFLKEIKRYSLRFEHTPINLANSKSYKNRVAYKTDSCFHDVVSRIAYL